MEDVTARKLLGGRRGHLLPADDAHIVRRCKLFGGCVGIEGVHVMDGSP